MTDPTDLDALRRLVHGAIGARAAAAIRTRAVVIDDDALAQLPHWIDRLAPGGGDVVLVWDDRPMQRGPAALKPFVRRLAAGTGRSLRTVEMTRDLHADEHAAATVRAAVGEQSVVVAVGSGNLTDTCKHACCRPGTDAVRHVPLISIPSASSVNAYSSSLAILIVNGVKRSLPSVPPDVILCDLPTLASAPAAMQRAGLGDMLARCVAPGDWFLAHVLGMDDAYSDAAYVLLGDAEQRVLDAASEIGARTASGTRVLTEALVLSGLVLSAAEQTAPLSGWEHVISHYLDLTALAAGRPLALHGAQVGVGTVTSAEACASFIDGASPADVPLERVFPGRDAVRGVLDAHFRALDPGGQRRAELWGDADAKWQQWHGQHERWRAFCADWAAGRIQAELRRLVRAPAVVRNALSAAGCPTTFADLDPAVGPDLAAAAVRHAHLVRRRFTFGDLLNACGLLEQVTVA